MIDFDALKRVTKKREPFTYFYGENIISPAQAARVRDSYPQINKSGYLPLSKLTVEGAFAELIDDLNSKQFAQILSDNLGMDLTEKPRMITVRKVSKIGDGRVHNDSVSKICTFLIYLNENWQAGEAGAIRVLNNDHDMNDFTDQVLPHAGNVFAFLRSDTSWHGHPPFKGERYVIQTTFLINEDALARKENRGGFQYFLKKLNPFAR